MNSDSLKSCFQRFSFEERNSVIEANQNFDLPNNKSPTLAPICGFLEKVQAIFIDEIAGAQIVKIQHTC